VEANGTASLTASWSVLEVFSECLESAVRGTSKFSTLGQPEAWANRRQSLNEAIPWYRANQGSMYTRDKVLVGLMLAKEAEAGDVVTSHSIITSV
jgi:hypothetical protein